MAPKNTGELRLKKQEFVSNSYSLNISGAMRFEVVPSILSFGKSDASTKLEKKQSNPLRKLLRRDKL